MVWGDTSCNSYPELFRIYQDKKESVAEFMKFINGFLHWDVSFFFLWNKSLITYQKKKFFLGCQWLGIGGKVGLVVIKMDIYG